MNWVMLIIAGFFETCFAFCLGKARYATGIEARWWMLGFYLSLTVSMFLLYKAVQTLPVGTAYAVWTGIGAAGTAIVGILFFREQTDFWRLFFLATLILSVAGLKFVSE